MPVRPVESRVIDLPARRGLPTAEHCEHCVLVDAIGEQLASPCDVALNRLARLEQISDALDHHPGRVDLSPPDPVPGGPIACR